MLTGVGGEAEVLVRGEAPCGGGGADEVDTDGELDEGEGLALVLVAAAVEREGSRV